MACFFIYGLLVVLFCIFFYGIFLTVSNRQSYALNEICKYSTVVNNVGRFDYIGIVFLLFSSIVSLAVPIYFCCYSINIAFNVKYSFITPIIVNSITFLFLTFSNTFISVFVLDIIHYGCYFFVFIGNILPIILSFLRSKKYAVFKK